MKDTLVILNLKFDTSILYVENIRDLIVAGSTHIELDFTSMTTIEPFGIVYFSNFIKSISRIRGLEISCVYIDKDVSYAKHMGFFKNCGFDIGAEPRDSFPTKATSYVPITILDVGSLRQEAIDSYKEVGDIIENYSINLAKLLTSQKDDTPLVDTLTYCFREIIRNVVEHSGSKKITFCAQYWPYLGKAEIVVLDRGKGILNSLNENTTLPKINDDKEALNFALLPSISSKVPYAKKRKSRNESFWKNSGFGLYMTHRIAGLGGDFFVASGKHGLRWVRDQKTDHHVRLKGTILRLLIETNNITELQDTLRVFREDGFALARQLTEMEIEPSSASLMLTKHRTK
ncbi:hypothetical protein [Acinetobacter sp. ANC 4805]|uniref:hypothetical protein n=1 Tax=Acinetobacter sp. ANC 4805 TaxID=2923425 RepID=UPI001F4B57A5|nr:hypothetical protein [Acinetobacter sp. ANC 4805]MCH7310862.1 hypothetical protein [Acinetobacter sp. ANC 4805]